VLDSFQDELNQVNAGAFVRLESILSSTSPTQTRDALVEKARDRTYGAKAAKLASVRVSPGGYFAMAAVATFSSLVLLRTEHNLAALLVTGATWIVVPLLVVTDRINFDGAALWRTGFVALIGRLVRGRPLRISVDDIERVEINALRTLRRGGSVRYRYRAEITGNRLVFVFASGGTRFRQMAQSLLARLPDEKLDSRALELREHLVDKKTVQAEVEQLGIAPAALLESSDSAKPAKRSRPSSPREAETTAEDIDRARLLRKAANDLRVTGRLRESAEAFRRALWVTPRDPWLVYEYARLLRSQASVTGDARMLSRARAALRLAATRAIEDARLLTRIGESFLEYGETEKARQALRRGFDIDGYGFRSQLGLAEVALNEGKLAHVIHHYNEAARIAPDQATATMSRRESEYYSRLNDDDDYLAAELRRMNWLQNVGRVQQLAARVSFASLLIALVGPSINQVVASLGWALASSSIMAWSTALIVTKLLATRRKAPAIDLS
jgi:tetratricopeptide (TPR) repeat protein